MQPHLKIRSFLTYQLDSHGQAISLDGQSTLHIVGQHLSKLLFSCNSFSTLNDHISTYLKKVSIKEKFLLLNDAIQLLMSSGKTLPFGTHFLTNTLNESLKILNEKGFFYSGNTPPLKLSLLDSQIKIASVMILTHNRPDMLLRCIKSYQSNLEKFNHNPTICVFDDSALQNTHQALIDSTMNNSSLYYCGTEEKNKFIAALAKEGIPTDLMTFALFGETGFATYGANRNASLLHSVGDCFFGCDDDTLCETYLPEGIIAGVQTDFEGTPEIAKVFPTREDAKQSVKHEEVDFIREHEKVLGLKFNIDEHPSNIIVSLNGLLGDNGMMAPMSHILSSGLRREYLLKTKESFDLAFKSRETVKHVNQKTFLLPPTFMTTFFGLDNRGLLPPFFPIMRNEDAHFCYLMNALFPQSTFAYLPFLLTHAPDQLRPYGDFLSPDSMISPEDITGELLHSIDFEKINLAPEVKMRIIGELIIKIGSCSVSEFENFLSNIWKKKITGSLLLYEGYLERYHDSPYYWKDMLHQLIRLNRSAIGISPSLIPSSMIDFLGKENAWKTYQGFIFKFGQLLKLWPDIVEKTKELKRKGVTLAQPIN